MSSASHLSNSTILNEINADFHNVVDEIKPKIEQVFLVDTNQLFGYCNETSKPLSDMLPMNTVEDGTTINVGKDGNNILTKDEIKLEKADFEEYGGRMTHEETCGTYIKEENPNILIKTDPEICNINRFNFCDNQALMKIEKYKSSYEENEPVHYVKDEKIIVDENYSVEDDVVEDSDENDSEPACAANPTCADNKSKERAPLPLHQHRPFTCHVCEKSFVSKSKLAAHGRVHSSERPFQCPHCKKQFGYKHNLMKHQRVHRSERPYECQICNKRFNYKAVLEIHGRTHTNLREFECGVCKKSFRYKHNLVGHERLHTNDRPFQCTVCGKDFKQKKDLARHEVVHAEESSFRCEHCSKRFKHHRSLKRHLRVHSNEHAQSESISELEPQ